MDTTITESCQQYHDGLITSRELLGKLIDKIGQVWSEGSDEDETENIARLANWLAHKLI